MKHHVRIAALAAALSLCSVATARAQDHKPGGLNKVGQDISKATKKAGRDTKAEAKRGAKNTKRAAKKAGSDIKAESKRAKKKL